MAEQGQAKRKRIQKLRAFREEMRCGTDLKLYAAYLVLESGALTSLASATRWFPLARDFVKHHLTPLDYAGALLEHPWIKSLIEVSRKRLDPRELLKMYREDPDSLKIANLKNPDQYWMPPETERTPPLESMSICAAMRALWEGGIGRRTQRCKPY